MKNFVLGTLAGAAAVVLGLVIAQEIIDYIQYQQVLRATEALINL